MKFSWFSVPIALALVCTGCASVMPTHVHSEENAAVATRMQETLRNYSSKEPSVYQAMLDNLQKFIPHEDAVISDLSRNRQDALMHLFSIATQADVENQIERINQDIEDADVFLRKTTQAYLAERDVLVSAASQTKESIGKVEEALKEAKANVTRWNATVAALQKAAGALPVAVDKAQDDKTGSDALKAALGAVGQETAEYVDSAGVKQQKKVQDILKDQIFADPKSKTVTLKVPDAPGIEVTILTLSLNLAEIEQERATARLHELARRFELFAETYASLRLARQLMTEEDVTAANVAPANLNYYLTLLQRGAEARRQLGVMGSNDPAVNDDAKTDAAKTLHQELNRAELGLKALRRMAVADTIAVRSNVVIKMALARYDHEESIIQSRLNDRAWRELLQAGVDGLKAYHDGGLSAEDVATVTRVLNTAALAVIAAD